MSPGVEFILINLAFLLLPIIFAIAQLALFGIGNRIQSMPAKTGKRKYPTAVVAAMVMLSILSFPAATFSLLAVFFALWEIVWPACALFIATGIGGLMGASWIMTSRSKNKAPALIVAGIVAGILTALALSILFVPWNHSPPHAT